MKYASLIPLLFLLLLCSCGDIINRTEWHDGIYTLDLQDTTTLITVYHDTHLWGNDHPAPVIVEIVEQGSNTEPQRLSFSLYIAEGDPGELTTKEVYTTTDGECTYKGKAAYIHSVSLNANGITLEMTIDGVVMPGFLHRLRGWRKLPLAHEKRYKLQVDTLEREITFQQRSNTKYVMFMDDYKDSTENSAHNITAEYYKPMGADLLATVFTSRYSATLFLEEIMYQTFEFYQTDTGLHFNAFGYYYNDSTSEYIEDTITQVLSPVE